MAVEFFIDDVRGASQTARMRTRHGRPKHRLERVDGPRDGGKRIFEVGVAVSWSCAPLQLGTAWRVRSYRLRATCSRCGLFREAWAERERLPPMCRLRHCASRQARTLRISAGAWYPRDGWDPLGIGVELG